jgi:DNA-binding MarR family transcriptional regulator
MVSTGLVKRSEDPEDRRFTMIELTQRGRNTAGEIDDINNKYYESAFKGMDGKEIDLMFQHLQSLVDTLEQVEKGRKT